MGAILPLPPGLIGLISKIVGICAVRCRISFCWIKTASYCTALSYTFEAKVIENRKKYGKTAVANILERKLTSMRYPNSTHFDLELVFGASASLLTAALRTHLISLPSSRSSFLFRTNFLRSEIFIKYF